ncbi:HAD-IIIC family phosphatase [Streptomyces sp. H27-S2]|uniref:HAD-IIIC family phosphatase n=1 Tax=Streptomyces antarcticus TaxID=2996458 RepID=UPI00226DBD70|nr:HAD-IIIC family phosphatase [Streptomyces sp. H27-S2]MCY0953002.1 HAD-IIIC family phosphatase [Streptomyces sp. H27-S2]
MTIDEFRFSAFLSAVDLDTGVLLANGPHMQRLVLDGEWAQPVRALRGAAFSAAGFAAVAPDPAAAADVLRALVDRNLVVPAGADEEEALRTLLADRPEAARSSLTGRTGSWPTTRYGLPQRLTAPSARHGSEAPEAVTYLLLGGCVTQFTEEPLLALGREQGLDVRTEHLWPGSVRDMSRAVARVRPDVTVYQAGVQPFLSALWDGAHTRDDGEREQSLTLMKSALSVSITALADALEGRLGLVHNFGPPALSPFGRFDFAEEFGFRRIVAELNAHIDHCVRRHPHLMVVDEERLVARHGAAALFDDLVFPSGHHGGSLDPSDERPHQLPALGHALATEYLACHRIHRGAGRIKLVVTDLDGTLWPGIAADDGFDWLDGDATSRWVHVGLHQALSVLKSRGVLLATSSKGDARATLGAWEGHGGARQLLGPDDFVLHRINWQAKSAGIADICARLGFAPEQVLFLDDNPVERAEVAAALPGLHVAEGPVHTFRDLLLSSPALESGPRTQEAARRTDTTRAMLRRQDLGATMDRDGFLRSLEIGLRVERGGERHLARVCELFNRTNQFTTTAWRTTPEELRRTLAAPDTRLHVAFASDRFADYGMTGACLVQDGTVTAFALSCRVIGLDIAVPFLTAALRDGAGGGRSLAGIRGHIVATDRNTPARDLFLDAGFTADTAAGRYVLAAGDRLPDLDGLPLTVSAGP